MNSNMMGEVLFHTLNTTYLKSVVIDHFNYDNGMVIKILCDPNEHSPSKCLYR